MLNLVKVLRLVPWVFCLIGVVSGAPASATILESYSISNSFGYLLGSAGGDQAIQSGGDEEHHFQKSTTDPNAQSELGVNYVSYAGDGGFFFLHQDYCVGTCSVSSGTVITATLTNTGDDSVDLRFDSMITPGHLALNGPSSGTSGSYTFSVKQVGSESSLYSSVGSIIQDGIMLNDGGLGFNGYKSTNPVMSNWQTIDWGATNLSLQPLTIAAHSSISLEYSAFYQIQNNGVCDDLSNCSSLEIVFGDPRNDGGVLALRSMFGAQSVEPLDKAIIGGAYDPFFVPFSFVPVGSPPAPDAPDAPVITYSSNFRSNALEEDTSAAPEPATWLTMICGFGVAGLALRRRRAVAVQAA